MNKLNSDDKKKDDGKDGEKNYQYEGDDEK